MKVKLVNRTISSATSMHYIDSLHTLAIYCIIHCLRGAVVGFLVADGKRRIRAGSTIPVRGCDPNFTYLNVKAHSRIWRRGRCLFFFFFFGSSVLWRSRGAIGDNAGAPLGRGQSSHVPHRQRCINTQR